MPLTTEKRYQVILGCDLCGIAWSSPEITTTLETLFKMNEKALCPGCSATQLHDDPYLQVPPVVLKISDLDNEFAIISQF